MGFEYFGNAHASGGLNLGIGIDKSQFKPLGQTRAETGLARAHHANEHNRFCHADFLHNHLFPS